MRNHSAVWLYGSLARGESSPTSDIDVLVVGEPVRQLDLSMFGRRHASVSRYSWREIERMAEYGSVFLHHLKTEARPLRPVPPADRRLRMILEDLGPYRRASADLRAFQMTLDDVREALEWECSADYEMAVLGSVVRHASVLACFLAGGPVYGRERAFARLQALLGMPYDPVHELMNIYDYRLAEERGVPLREHATPDDVRAAVWLTQDLIDRMEGLVLDYT